ncbi:hypothetical protein SESBI_28776 [Sesbania bispinosa]|nr:hypothetical protein SESBI_28776 [Sesbania bispinosa]
MLRNAALGQENEKSKDDLFSEEEDNLARSIKKAKVDDLKGESQVTIVMETALTPFIVNGEEEVEPVRKSSKKVSMAEAESPKAGKESSFSYKDAIMGGNGVDSESSSEDDDEESVSDTGSSEGEAGIGVGVDHSDPLCPEITISYKEWKRACKPWRNSVIVKVLGKRLG